MYRIVSVLVTVCVILVSAGSSAAREPAADNPPDVSHLEGRLAFPVFEDGTYGFLAVFGLATQLEPVSGTPLFLSLD